MLNSNRFKSELENLYKDESNSNCFDCDNRPAHWASVNNGIYLCLDCSGEHRGFGVSVSYIKSVTWDQWNESQFNLLRVGGNWRLKNFWYENGIPDDLDKKDIYSSKLMSYYRRMWKSESKSELFMEPLPPKLQFWEPVGNEANAWFNKNDAYSNSWFSNKNTLNSYNNAYKSNDFNNQEIPWNTTGTGNTSSDIFIKDDHYKQARETYVASQYTNSIPTEPKFSSCSNTNSNDARFASIGSDQISSSDNSSPGYFSSVGGWLGTVLRGSAIVAGAVKDKMNEMEVGSKLIYVGGKAVEAITYTGGKVIEKGTEIAKSETIYNIASKAGEGLGYIKEKIVGKGNSSNSISSDSYSQSWSGNYSSTGSDSYDRY